MRRISRSGEDDNEERPELVRQAFQRENKQDKRGESGIVHITREQQLFHHSVHNQKLTCEIQNRKDAAQNQNLRPRNRRLPFRRIHRIAGLRRNSEILNNNKITTWQISQNTS